MNIQLYNIIYIIIKIIDYDNDNIIIIIDDFNYYDNNNKLKY